MKEQQLDAPSESIKRLLEHKLYLERQATFGKSRSDRMANRLARRHSARKLSPEKRDRMIRRHMAAISQYETAVQLLDQVNFRIQQLTSDDPVL